MYTIGTHMSIAGGLAKTAENVVKMNADTMQIFSRNPRGSSYKTYLPEEIERFQKIRKDHAFGPVLAHAPYTMNLASATGKTYEFACTVITVTTLISMVTIPVFMLLMQQFAFFA